MLEENQRLQIRYNNLVGTYDTWQKQVTLHAERELAQKLSSAREVLASKYDEALAERTRQFTAESARLRKEDEKLHHELMRAKEAHMRMLGQQLEEQRRSHKAVLGTCLVALVIVLSLAYFVGALLLKYRALETDHEQLKSDYQLLRRQASDNHRYLAGNGVKSALVRFLKPTLPHIDLLALSPG